jgi:hypothetical protein
VWVGAGDAPARGSQDAEILEWCARERRLLLTRDRSTMPAEYARHLARGVLSCGVLVIRRDAVLARLVEDLLLVVGASEAEECIDRLTYLPL